MAKKIYVDGVIDGELTVGEYTLPEVDGTSGQVLKTDGLGALIWQDDTSGSGTLAGLSDVVGVDYTGGTILVGDGADSFDQVAMSGDVTIDSSGVTTIGAGAVEKSMIENLSDMTVLGNVSGGVAAPAEVTIDTDISTVPGDDSELASSDAIKTYVDAQVSAVIGKYTDDFVIADWAGTPLTITYAAATHGLTTDDNLMVQVQEAGTPSTVVDVQVDIAAGGDVTITTNTAFDGKIIIVG